MAAKKTKRKSTTKKRASRPQGDPAQDARAAAMLVLGDEHLAGERERFGAALQQCAELFGVKPVHLVTMLSKAGEVISERFGTQIRELMPIVNSGKDPNVAMKLGIDIGQAIGEPVRELMRKAKAANRAAVRRAAKKKKSP